jgi:hypothetical protein
LINNRNVFLSALEAGKPKTKMLADSVSTEGWLSSKMAPLAVFLHGRRNRRAKNKEEVPLSPFIRPLMPLTKAESS